MKPSVGTRIRIDSIQWPACARTSILISFAGRAPKGSFLAVCGLLSAVCGLRSAVCGLRSAGPALGREQVRERAVAICLEQLAEAADRAFAHDDLRERHLTGP